MPSKNVDLTQGNKRSLLAIQNYFDIAHKGFLDEIVTMLRKRFRLYYSKNIKRTEINIIEDLIMSVNKLIELRYEELSKMPMNEYIETNWKKCRQELLKLFYQILSKEIGNKFVEGLSGFLLGKKNTIFSTDKGDVTSVNDDWILNNDLLRNYYDSADFVKATEGNKFRLMMWDDLILYDSTITYNAKIKSASMFSEVFYSQNSTNSTSQKNQYSQKPSKVGEMEIDQQDENQDVADPNLSSSANYDKQLQITSSGNKKFFLELEQLFNTEGMMNLRVYDKVIFSNNLKNVNAYCEYIKLIKNISVSKKMSCNDEFIDTIIEFLQIPQHHSILDILGGKVDNEVLKDFVLIKNFLDSKIKDAKEHGKGKSGFGKKEFKLDKKFEQYLNMLVDKLNMICNKPIDEFMEYIEDVVEQNPELAKKIDKGLLLKHLSYNSLEYSMDKNIESHFSENKILKQKRMKDYFKDDM